MSNDAHNTGGTVRAYIEATIVRNRSASWADNRVTRSGDYEGNSLEDAKQKFVQDHEDEPGFERVDWEASRVRTLTAGTERDDTAETGDN